MPMVHKRIMQKDQQLEIDTAENNTAGDFEMEL